MACKLPVLDFRAKWIFAQSELEQLFALREALEYVCVIRLHGTGVATSVWGKLSSCGRAAVQDETLDNMLRCRQTWDLDR